ncbi:DNA repair protein RecN [Sphingomonas sp. KRR8]|uniref:DNA repair protein RecN n=1 Tax=Sphingomonas sp. KRR8 TaxID=2942996 RepID=UPI00202006C6|nr:DNA repair protein RecN [Sphingomonas sp. KRR8]URD59870.1 DNA repair protein RecN [Sphingomonas sp. KRR8]
MLRQLVIRDVVLIDRLELEFGTGLGVLTGETGAGKSILLDALGLALGARADSGLVRSGQEGAAVSAAFDLSADHPGLTVLDEAGVEAEPGEPLLLRRQVKADGGSRAFAAGAPVPAAVLREVGATLVEIHGQHDDRGLLNPKGHRDLLDAFARIDVRPVSDAWSRWQAVEEDLAQARASAQEAERDRDYLTHAADEIAKLAPDPGEETSLAEQRAAMQAGARAGEALQGLDELLGGSDGALALLRAAARKIERGAADHPLLAEALAGLDRAVIETAEAEERIGRAADEMSFDPQRLELVESRLFDIRALARKHRVEADALAALGADMQARLALIEAGGERIARLERSLAQARQDYEAAAAGLTQTRSDAAVRLDAAVNDELAPLKLESASFRTSLSPAAAGPSGSDRVEFTVSTNPGAPFGALTKIASGGELSRFILALKVALAEAGSASTMIFDEIDRGVGGAVASAIGERLARLAQQSQLLVVTHSPQVAARAQHHYRIEKSHGEAGTRTTVRKLSPEERREEIARMLSGADVTDEARAQAARLLAA